LGNVEDTGRGVLPLLGNGEEAPMKYRVLIEPDEDGVFVAQVPSLPGCVSQGPTRAEALSNVHEAIAAYLESLKAHDEPIPPPIEEEVVDVAM
jgi:predicted RNase H-like HicB family nuclease